MHLLLAVLVAAAACGGSANGTTDQASMSTRGRHPPGETPAAAPAPAAREPHPPIPTEAMLQQLLAQRVIDHPRVAPYLHLEHASNVPLSLHAIPDLAQGAPRLRAGGRNVDVVADPAAARLLLTSREPQVGHAARVRIGFAIPPEGVTGHVELELRDHVWTAIDARVVER